MHTVHLYVNKSSIVGVWGVWELTEGVCVGWREAQIENVLLT